MAPQTPAVVMDKSGPTSRQDGADYFAVALDTPSSVGSQLRRRSNPDLRRLCWQRFPLLRLSNRDRNQGRRDGRRRRHRVRSPGRRQQADVPNRWGRAGRPSVGEAGHGGPRLLHWRRGDHGVGGTWYGPAISWNVAENAGYGLHYPIRHGQIENWVGMSRVQKRADEAGSHGAVLV
jgi:hypothetical protein